MGDRHFEIRHPNLEFMLRRGDGYLAGIGHNGGPPLLDMSWTAWIWRKAMARAWAPPPREVVLRRLARAERLGMLSRHNAELDARIARRAVELGETRDALQEMQLDRARLVSSIQALQDEVARLSARQN